MLVDGDGTGGQAQGYMPWGETRYGGVETEYQFTGQYRLAALGLDYYGARWYDSSLGRWAQADTVVPDYYYPQDWDRYSYTRNNPIIYSDPSGHKPLGCTGDDIEDCTDQQILSRYNVHLRNKEWYNKRWGSYYRLAVVMAVLFTGKALAAELGQGMSWADAFKSVYQDGIVMTWGEEGASPLCLVDTSGGACTSSSRQINFFSLTIPMNNRTFDMALKSAINNVVHELGHAFASIFGNSKDGPYMNIPSELLRSEGFAQSPKSASRTWRQNPSNTPHEIFADMFLGWTFNMWSGDRKGYGKARHGFMSDNMPGWVNMAASR